MAARAGANEPLMLLSNARLQSYRLALAPAHLDANGDLWINTQTAAVLQVVDGDSLRYVLSQRPMCSQASAVA
jgi:arginine/ornithine N-succinyltransferase beta subunit